jgi:hypothetical protein
MTHRHAGTPREGRQSALGRPGRVGRQISAGHVRAWQGGKGGRLDVQGKAGSPGKAGRHARDCRHSRPFHTSRGRIGRPSQ